MSTIMTIFSNFKEIVPSFRQSSWPASILHLRIQSFPCDSKQELFENQTLVDTLDSLKNCERKRVREGASHSNLSLLAVTAPFCYHLFLSHCPLCIVGVNLLKLISIEHIVNDKGLITIMLSTHLSVITVNTLRNVLLRYLGDGVPPHIGYIGMSSLKAYGFLRNFGQK